MKKALVCVLLICVALVLIFFAEPIRHALSPPLASPAPILMPSPSPAPLPSPTVAPTPTPEPTPDLTGLARNPLTGAYIDEEVAARRPIAVVINNKYAALPQSGIAQASLYYEVLSEGAITRIIAVFQDFDAAKIGPIRSMRHYFLDFALDHDAIFAHHGHSPQGKAALQNLGINNIEGMYVDGTYYWRDPERKKIPAMYEHSSYTSAENLWSYITDKAKYRTAKAETHTGMFAFYDAPTSPANSTPVMKITINYINSFTPSFTYNAETHLYARTQYGEPHIDEQTGEQLTVTNIIVQNAEVWHIPGDASGRRDVALVASGTGTLYTNGTASPVTWTKTSHQSPTQWFDAQGKPLTLNIGKTWVCVTQNASTVETD